MKYIAGDKVEVALKWDWYVPNMIRAFEKNNVVEILFYFEQDKDYKVKDYLGNTWWVYEKDIIWLVGLENQCGYFIS